MSWAGYTSVPSTIVDGGSLTLNPTTNFDNDSTGQDWSTFTCDVIAPEYEIIAGDNSDFTTLDDTTTGVVTLAPVLTTVNQSKIISFSIVRKSVTNSYSIDSYARNVAG